MIRLLNTFITGLPKECACGGRLLATQKPTGQAGGKGSLLYFRGRQLWGAVRVVDVCPAPADTQGREL